MDETHSATKCVYASRICFTCQLKVNNQQVGLGHNIVFTVFCKTCKQGVVIAVFVALRCS